VKNENFNEMDIVRAVARKKYTASDRISWCIFFELWSAKSYCVSHLIHGRNEKAGTKSGEMRTEVLLSLLFFFHWFSSSKILQQKLVVMTVFTTCIIRASCIFCFGRTGILGYAI